MLEENAIDAFLDNIKLEKDLYLPFMAMLRAQGFQKIQILAGHYEHGKDIIAQKTQDDGSVVQYAFPIKRGNLDQEKLGKLRDQINESIDFSDSHLDFDGDAPLQIAVVFPGSVVGKVSDWIQSFNKKTARKLGILPVQLWGRDQLKEMFRTENCLQKIKWEDAGAFLQSIAEGAGVSHIESWTASWHRTHCDASSVWAKAVEVSFLSTILQKQNLRLHAIQLFYCLLRTAITLEHQGKLSKEEVSEFTNLVKLAVYEESKEFLAWFETLPKDQRTTRLLRFSPSELVEFPVRTMLILQFLSLSVISLTLTQEEAKIARDFFETVLGIEALAKPLSDNFAPTILAIACACHFLQLDVKQWLKNVARWVCECVQVEPGLAPSGASIEEELWRTCGSSLNHDDYAPNHSSTLAAAILDLCSVMGQESLYDEISADLLSLRIIPRRKIPINAPSEFYIEEKACLTTSHSDYSKKWEGKEGWQNSTVHEKADEARLFNDGERDWIGITLGLVCRDRWWLRSVREISNRTTPYAV